MTVFQNSVSVRYSGIGRFLIGVLLAFSATGCQQDFMRLTGEAQGTYYSVQYIDPQHRNLQQQIDSLLTTFDQTASLWVDNSEVRRVNAGLTDTVSVLFADLLDKSKQMTDYTDGAFDVRIGKLVQAWGFSFRQREKLDSLTIDSLLSAAQGDISISNNHITRQYPTTELDFNAIAQGYSVDLIAKYLDNKGIENYLIDVGGEVISRGCKADGKPWIVGIERPAENPYSTPEVQTAIALRDQSVVTSGNYRKYYEKDGVRYSHTIDPSTGRPVEHSLLSASVVESECWLADAMATAYMVMGLDSALSFIASHPGQPGTGAVYFIYDDGGSFKTYATPEFMQLEQK